MRRIPPLWVTAHVCVLLLACSVCPGALAQLSPPLTPDPRPPTTDSPALTNVAQLIGALASAERLYRDVQLDLVVCAASRPSRGVLVVQDGTGVELLELGRRTEEIAPGERIRIEGQHLFLRRRESGTQISAAPILDNDGLHGWQTVASEVVLKAGRVPLELDWFNCLRNFGLQVTCELPRGQPQGVPESALWHRPPTTDHRPLAPGLQVQAYEGNWEKVPDFDLLEPVKTGSTPNFDLAFRTRDELTGLRFTGFFDAPLEGKYTFRVTSDDGALLFVGPPEAPVRRLGTAPVPAAQVGVIGELMNGLEERRWLAVAGRVSFISRRGGGLDLELRSGVDTFSVEVVDASGLEPAALLNTYVRAVGVGRAALSASQRVVLDRLFVIDRRGLLPVSSEPENSGPPLALVDISHVQTMRVREAQRGLSVRVRGVVTAANRSDRWFSLQDDTRGIFVDHHSLSNTFPATAELWEVVGHTAPGNFAPIVVADQMRRLGRGRLPEPGRPSWNELANGSQDVQWVEFQGLVSKVHSNRLTLLLAEGPLEVQMENYFEPDLKPFEQALVRLRGTLFAIWNAETREVQFGTVRLRNGSISVEAPPPASPFDAPLKSARDLLLFDPEASAFRPVKVRAQVLYADAQRIFAVDEGMGLRVLAAQPAQLQPGDLVEAVGYPEIGGPSPLLRQALVRNEGTAPLPEPVRLTRGGLLVKGLDSTLVRVEGKLIGLHSEQNATVLEMQSGGHLFLGRVKPGGKPQFSPRLGSQVQLTGVYAQSGRNRGGASQVEAFEVLLNSPLDLVVLSQPSWWTLERLAVVVGLLVLVLLLAAAWIHQLRRQVEQRTAQLQREMRERERAERHHALEAERSRIARDLHDDLGSSLTEIGVLASTGQRTNEETGNPAALYEAIAGKARGSLAALDVIVWAVDPEDNSLQSVADYLSGFASEYLSHFQVACRFKIPVAFPQTMLEGRVRHDLFLAVKETLNNVVRHAQASEVEFGMAAGPGGLEIVMGDNGKGFDPAAVREGNGLKNLRARLARLGGSCRIESQASGGTKITIRLPLPAPEAEPHSSC